MNTLEKVNAVIGTIEKLLACAAFRKKKDHPVMKLARVALVRELFWAEQLSASLRGGVMYDVAFRGMMFNSEIVDSCSEELQECMTDDC
jgi:hypothetical protein